MARNRKSGDANGDKKRKYKFKREKSHVFTVLDENKKELGSVRVKPNSVGWKPAGETHWYRLSILEFSEIALERGFKREIA
jgi:hypothetical protein